MTDNITLADHFADLAKRFRANARKEKGPKLKAAWEHLADCYLQMANRTDQDRLSEWARGLNPSHPSNPNI